MHGVGPCRGRRRFAFGLHKEAGYGDQVAVVDHYHGGKGGVSFTYSEFREHIRGTAAGLQHFGLAKGVNTCLFSENSHRWLLLDQAVMMCGAFSSVRGATAPVDELLYIMEDSQCQVLVCETADLLDKLLDESGADCQFQVIDVQRDDLATLVYTSGTTGNPKGVMLTHGNLLSMMLDFSFHSRSATTVPNDPAPGDIMSAEYIMLSSGCRLFYTNKKHLKDDIAKQKPQFLIAVPRLYNVIYQGVQKKLKAKPPKVQKLLAFLTASCHKYMMAKRLLHNMDLQHSMVHLSAPSLMARVRCLLTMALLWPVVQVADLLMWKTIRQALGGKAKILACGGASLPSHLEDFYEMLGVPITVGYGLTETSPVIAMRLVERNTPGTCGPPVYSCDLKVVDEETGETLPPLQRGLIKVKGARVTPGYYRNPAATAKLFDEDGYMDTGDVGVMLGTGELVITGRMKELIVLQNGENVAPAPIEDSILTSDLIEQVMVVGQDKKTLGALLVPNLEELHDRKLITEEDFQEITLAHETQDSVGLRKLAERLYADKSVKLLVQQDVMRSVQAKQGYVPSEKVTDFRFVLDPFSVENHQLTQTLKVKRNIVERNHAQEIQEIFTS